MHISRETKRSPESCSKTLFSENLAAALQKVKTKSLRGAALAYSIPKSKLARLSTWENHNTRLVRSTVLSAEDEYAIAKWLSFMAAGRFPVYQATSSENHGTQFAKSA